MSIFGNSILTKILAVGDVACDLSSGDGDLKKRLPSSKKGKGDELDELSSFVNELVNFNVEGMMTYASAEGEMNDYEGDEGDY